MIPTFFIISILVVLWLRYQTARSERSRKSATDAFWEKELRANTTRKKDLSSLDYINVPWEKFPVIHADDDEELSDALLGLSELSDAKIVNFTGITNTELKLAYGAPNITLLTEYDQNYLKLVRSLYQIGRLLYARGRADEAIPFLSYGVEIGSDISANYTLLATIYKEKNAIAELDGVIAAAQTLHSLTKHALLESLAAIRDPAIVQKQSVD